MLGLLILSFLAQSKVGNPAAPPLPAAPAPQIDAQALGQAIADRMAAKFLAQQQATQDALERLAVVVAKLAAVQPAPPPPAPPALPPEKVRIFTARDNEGGTWEGTDQKELLDWIDARNARNLRVRAASLIQTVPVVTVPIRTVTVAAPRVYYAAPAATTVPCLTGNCNR